jgi:DNA-binding transcriptional LysR family regulator
MEVKVSIGLCDELRKRVQHGDLDAALTLDGSDGTPRHDDSWSRTLSPTRLRLIVSSPPAPSKENVNRADLARRTFLLPDPDGAFPALLRAWFGMPIFRLRFESAGSIDGVKCGVRSGDCIGVLPDCAVAEELAAGTLFELKVREPLPAVAVGLTMQRRPFEASPLHDMIQQIECGIIGSDLSD